MIVKSAEFIISAASPHQFPDTALPEFAFAGKSNVGKSSMINTLLSRKRLCKTSNTPGRTQLINFFLVNSLFYFVDLPGYGYAKVPVQIRKQWKQLIESYLTKRNPLKAVVVLLDMRHPPNRNEHDFITWLQHYNFEFIVILTKADKLSKNQQNNQIRLIRRELTVDQDHIIPFSAKTRQGQDRIWPYLENCLSTQDQMDNVK